MSESAQGVLVETVLASGLGVASIYDINSPVTKSAVILLTFNVLPPSCRRRRRERPCGDHLNSEGFYVLSEFTQVLND